MFIFDIYQTSLLKEDDVVLDLGATIGEFSILASRKVGENGRVIAIEPNAEDYELLIMNIKRNGCQNVIPINLGVGSEIKETEITFWGKTFTCKINTLENILNELNINDKINFVKMDIEGLEVDVVKQNIELFREANVVSLECHNTKEKIDELLLPYGFSFKPIDANYIYKKMIRNLVFHPSHFFKASVHTVIENPKLTYKVLIGYDMFKDGVDQKRLRLLTGAYVKGR